MPIRILHLSDIHFKDYTGKELFDTNKDVRSELEADLTIQIEKAGPINLILIGGDIAYGGKEEEYSVADAWIKTLCSITGCRLENVLMVPGNHDVDRSKISQRLKEIHEEFKSKDSLDAVTATIEKYMADPGFKVVLQRPLETYDNFALKYGAVSPDHKMFWESSFDYNGFTFCIRGINSALISNDSDEEKTSKLAIGSMQCIVPRKSRNVNIVLCHHPPSWLIDGDTVESYLCARSALLLFGHLHAFSTRQIDNTLLLAAGAVQPGRFESNWEPRYNIIELHLNGNFKPEILNVKLWKRVWSKPTLRFKSDGRDQKSEFDIFNLNITDEPEIEQEMVETEANLTQEVMSETENKLKINEPNNIKILAYRFMSLPYHLRLRVATNLHLQKDTDEGISDIEKTKAYFERVREKDLFRALWSEINEQQEEQLPNPFDP